MFWAFGFVVFVNLRSWRCSVREILFALNAANNYFQISISVNWSFVFCILVCCICCICQLEELVVLCKRGDGARLYCLLSCTAHTFMDGMKFMMRMLMMRRRSRRTEMKKMTVIMMIWTLDNRYKWLSVYCDFKLEFRLWDMPVIWDQLT